MNPEERHLAIWLRTHKNPALLGFVDSEVVTELNAVPDFAPEEPVADEGFGYGAWVKRRSLPASVPLQTAPFNFARFLAEGGFQESFERIGCFYVLHAYPTDGRRKARLRQLWSPSAWTLLEESAQKISPAQDLETIHVMADELQTTQIKEWVGVLGLYAFSCAAGRRYWRQTELVAQRLDPAMRKVLRGFVTRNQLADREKLAPHFRRTLGKVLDHGEG